MACFEDGCFNEFGGEAHSMRIVFEWLNSIPNLKNLDGTINGDVLGKAVHESVNDRITVFSYSESECSNTAIKSSKPRNKKKQNFQTVNEESPVVLQSHKQRKTNEDSGVSTSNSNSSSEDLVQGSLFALQKWTIFKLSSCELGLRGDLSSVNSRSVTTEDFFAGKILSRLNPSSIKTNKGVFNLIGKLHDPDNEIPAEVKKQFSVSFPVKWRKIVCDHWKVSASGKGVKRLNDSDVFPPPKVQKVSSNDSESNKKECETELPVRRKKNSKLIEETNNEGALEIDSKPLNGRVKTKLRSKAKKVVHKNGVVANEQKSDSGFESVPCQSMKKSDKVKKAGAKGKKVNKSTVNKRKRPNLVASVDNMISETPCKKKFKKRKREKDKSDHNIIIGTDRSDFAVHLNKTGEFFRTFDDDCLDNGIQLHSFKEERSLGGCSRSAEKNSNIIGKESPFNKYVAEVFSHSLASNRSGQSHSVHSSPEKRMDVGKRIKKFNKGKKTSDKSGKRKNIKSKRTGDAEVNAVFKQITQKTNVLSTTPKIIKKIFRKKAYDDDPEDESAVFNSTEHESDSENDF